MDPGFDGRRTDTVIRGRETDEDSSLKSRDRDIPRGRGARSFLFFSFPFCFCDFGMSGLLGKQPVKFLVRNQGASTPLFE